MSEDSTIIATALLTRHNAWLDAKGVASSRYSRALAHLVADQVKRLRGETMKDVILTAIYNRAITRRDEALSGADGDLSEDEQRAIFDKVVRFQAIADSAEEALNGQ